MLFFLFCLAILALDRPIHYQVTRLFGHICLVGEEAEFAYFIKVFVALAVALRVHVKSVWLGACLALPEEAGRLVF